jgi:hypothetical protein
MARSRLSAGFEDQRRVMLNFMQTTNAKAKVVTDSAVDRAASLNEAALHVQVLECTITRSIIDADCQHSWNIDSQNDYGSSAHG